MGEYRFDDDDDLHDNDDAEQHAPPPAPQPDLENFVMDDAIVHALAHDLTIDITTMGCKTGQPRRIEIWFHNLDGELYLTGLPRPCSWYANLYAHPDFTFHLKESVQADLVARGAPVLEPAKRRDIIARIQQKLGRTGEDLEERVASSPLIKIELASR